MTSRLILSFLIFIERLQVGKKINQQLTDVVINIEDPMSDFFSFSLRFIAGEDARFAKRRSVLDGFHRTRNVADLIWSGLAAGGLNSAYRCALSRYSYLRVRVWRLDHVHRVSIQLYCVSGNTDLTIIYLATGARQINGTQDSVTKIGQPSRQA